MKLSSRPTATVNYQRDTLISADCFAGPRAPIVAVLCDVRRSAMLDVSAAAFVQDAVVRPSSAASSAPQSTHLSVATVAVITIYD